MDRTKRIAAVLVILLFAVSLSCNLISALIPDVETPAMPEAIQESAQEIQVEEPAEPEELVEVVPSDTPKPASVEEPELDQFPTWLIAKGQHGITYINPADGVIHTLEFDGEIQVFPAPIGGKVAIRRSPNDELMFWLEIVDLETEEITTITPLMAESLPRDHWESFHECEPTGEAFWAVSTSTPFWNLDGSAFVFISAHEGGYARAYSYFPATGEIRKHEFGDWADGVHFFQPKIGADGGLTYTLSSAACFITAYGYPEMDALWLSTPEGDFSARLLELSGDHYGVEVFGRISDMFVIIASKDDSFTGRNTAYHHLRAVNIYTMEAIEITDVNDHLLTVQVAQPFNSVAFITLEGQEGDQVTERGVYYWNIFDQQLVKLHDHVDDECELGWNFNKTTYFAKVEDERSQTILLTFLEDGTQTQLWEVSALGIPVFPTVHGIHDYYAWLDHNGLFVQSFDDFTPVKLCRDMFTRFQWHPEIPSLAFSDNTAVYRADAPYFEPVLMMQLPEKVGGVLWVGP
jgi:hypothetical protein